MKKTAMLLMPFIISSCMPRTAAIQTGVPKETVKQIETKAADISQAQLLAVKELDGYFLKNSVKLDNEINFFALSSQNDLEKILGVSKTVDDAINAADFKNAMVAVIAMKPSQKLSDIKIKKAYSLGSDVYLEYDITPGLAPDAGYFVSGMKAFEVQKPRQILNVSFVNADKSMTIVPFGKRVAGSPASLEALVKYYTGRYKGTIPAADCPGISMVLMLSQDYTYRLEQTYLTNPARKFESSGKWSPSEDLSFFVLDYEKPENERTVFYFVDKNTIEMLNTDKEKSESMPELYRLKK